MTTVEETLRQCIRPNTYYGAYVKGCIVHLPRVEVVEINRLEETYEKIEAHHFSIHVQFYNGDTLTLQHMHDAKTWSTPTFRVIASSDMRLLPDHIVQLFEEGCFTLARVWDTVSKNP